MGPATVDTSLLLDQLQLLWIQWLLAIDPLDGRCPLPVDLLDGDDKLPLCVDDRGQFLLRG